MPLAIEANRQGVVVMPADGDMEQIKKKIADAFSDNVTINPNDEKSGIIIPDLKMIPVKNIYI